MYRKSFFCSKIVDEHRKKVWGRPGHAAQKNLIGQVSGNKQLLLRFQEYDTVSVD